MTFLRVSAWRRLTGSSVGGSGQLGDAHQVARSDCRWPTLAMPRPVHCACSIRASRWGSRLTPHLTSRPGVRTTCSLHNRGCVRLGFRLRHRGMQEERRDELRRCDIYAVTSGGSSASTPSAGGLRSARMQDQRPVRIAVLPNRLSSALPRLQLQTSAHLLTASSANVPRWKSRVYIVPHHLLGRNMSNSEHMYLAYIAYLFPRTAHRIVGSRLYLLVWVGWILGVRHDRDSRRFGIAAGAHHTASEVAEAFQRSSASE